MGTCRTTCGWGARPYRLYILHGKFKVQDKHIMLVILAALLAVAMASPIPGHHRRPPAPAYNPVWKPVFYPHASTHYRHHHQPAVPVYQPAHAGSHGGNKHPPTYPFKPVAEEPMTRMPEPTVQDVEVVDEVPDFAILSNWENYMTE